MDFWEKTQQSGLFFEIQSESGLDATAENDKIWLNSHYNYMIQELLVYLIFAVAAVWLGYKLFFSGKPGGCDQCGK